MKMQNEKGRIRMTNEVFTNITGAVATSCYGVKGMAIRSATDGLVHLLRKESMSKGVKITHNEDHSVSFGVGDFVLKNIKLIKLVAAEVRRLSGLEQKIISLYNVIYTMKFNH